MKRSEIIESLVYHCLSWDGLDTSGVPAEEIANDILTHLEKVGMLSTRVRVEEVRKAISPEGEEGTFISWTYKSVWEDEDLQNE